MCGCYFKKKKKLLAEAWDQTRNGAELASSGLWRRGGGTHVCGCMVASVYGVPAPSALPRLPRQA